MSREGEVFLQAGAEAFGTGQHPTTALALEAMLALAREGEAFASILDMGCGSGILSLVAAGLWPQASILAVDSEASAVTATASNAAENGVAERISALRSEGFAHRGVMEKAPYDLVLCNIYAEPIIAMASPMKAALARGGVAVLSGILPWLEKPVVDAYQACGFTHGSTYAQENWRCLVIRSGPP